MPDSISLERRDDEELERLAGRTRGSLAKESLAVLIRREAPAAASLAVDLVTAHADPQVRSLAAVALGRSADPDARNSLVGALRDPDPVVVRRAAQSLVKVGDAAALERLTAIRPEPGTPLDRDVRASRMLLGYRLGSTEFLAVPQTVTEFGRRRGQAITFGGRSRLPKAAIVESARRELPQLAVSAESVRSFTCSGVQGALVLDASVVPADLGDALARPRMLGALLRDRVCSERMSVDCYLLSDDRDGTRGSRPRLWLVRPGGRVVHVGVAEVGQDGARFAVTGSVAPLAHPVKVIGTVSASGRITIETSMVGKPATDAVRAEAPPLRVR